DMVPGLRLHPFAQILDAGHEGDHLGISHHLCAPQACISAVPSNAFRPAGERLMMTSREKASGMRCIWPTCTYRCVTVRASGQGAVVRFIEQVSHFGLFASNG